MKLTVLMPLSVPAVVQPVSAARLGNYYGIITESTLMITSILIIAILLLLLVITNV